LDENVISVAEAVEDTVGEEERTKEMANRVEDARKKVMAEREEKRKNAPQITAQLLEGVDYSEEVVVKMVDGTYGTLAIHPLGEGDVVEAFNKFGPGSSSTLDVEDALNLKNYRLLWEIVSLSTGFPIDLLKKKLAMGESPIIVEKIFAISGMSTESETEVESFLA